MPKHSHGIRNLLVALAFAPAVALAGAGHDGREHGHGGGHGHAAFEGGQPGTATEVDRTIQIEAGDIHFDRERIKVREGETVRFVVTNTGQLLHDFTLGTPELQKQHRKEMAQMAMNGNHMHAHAAPNAVALASGETETLIWTFDEAESFQFACNVPGHYEAGMYGEIAIVDVPDDEDKVALRD